MTLVAEAAHVRYARERVSPYQHLASALRTNLRQICMWWNPERRTEAVYQVKRSYTAERGKLGELHG